MEERCPEGERDGSGDCRLILWLATESGEAISRAIGVLDVSVPVYFLVKSKLASQAGQKEAPRTPAVPSLSEELVS